MSVDSIIFAHSGRNFCHLTSPFFERTNFLFPSHSFAAKNFFLILPFIVKVQILASKVAFCFFLLYHNGDGRIPMVTQSSVAYQDSDQFLTHERSNNNREV